MTFTRAHVIALVRKPAREYMAILRRLTPAQRAELIALAVQLQRESRGVRGLGFLPLLGTFLFNAAKIVGTVATTAATGALTSVLGGSKQPEAPKPVEPAKPQTPAWVVPLAIGGVVLFAVAAGRR